MIGTIVITNYRLKLKGDKGVTVIMTLTIIILTIVLVSTVIILFVCHSHTCSLKGEIYASWENQIGQVFSY